MKKSRSLMTAEGLVETKAQLAQRLEKKEELKNLLDSTREAGDLRENDAYTLALEDFKNNEMEILRLEELVKTAKIVKAKTKGKVEIGDKVVVKDQNGKERTITLVGENGSDPLAGKISYISPLGKAMLNKSEGESFEFKTPKETVKYTIVDVLD
jgi:transcription elongation factor GreA